MTKNIDVTQVMVEEHKLILRMIALLENNVEKMEAGRFRDWRFFLDAVDFIRNYADRFHHAKEEDVLFKALVENGMPQDNSPVAAMLLAHDQGRAHVRAMEEGAQKALDGEPGQIALIAENARGYIALLRDHIDKEDNILYPLAERVLPEAPRAAMVEAYRRAEAQTPGLEEKYRQLVEKYEQQAAA
ncbi:hemerythrin domain-containing protein [Geoalkalibacter halelectricus]|uniref:Hemerythrin domain-containing protein n=1 Tax=Geoalkalibacter halelectricus TaxID=2847045 RepID=A0ABY5ZKS8_9BACT|nr:hemerythrin domain-containing protein [Geoalkalibacter halelectricus]MDO3378913.1 hemerythrin domain-containing protein [Geoalkalibacter halelectricus]UWZ79064.1 hemerythrin domain-containing protein [Geoalkalibacter halelectricus]